MGQGNRKVYINKLIRNCYKAGENNQHTRGQCTNDGQGQRQDYNKNKKYVGGE